MMMMMMMMMMLLQVQDLHITKSDKEIGFYAGLLGHHQSSLLSQQLQLNWSEIAVQIQEAGVDLSFSSRKKLRLIQLKSHSLEDLM